MRVNSAFGECDSWYRASSVRPELRWPTLASNARVDVAIVGGGFAGLWSGLLLAQSGLTVTLLEGGRVAGKASGRNGGFVSGGWLIRAERLCALMGEERGGHLYRLSLEGRNRVRRFLADKPDIVQGEGKLKVLRHADGGKLHEWGAMMNRRFGTRFEPWSLSRVQSHLKSKRYRDGLQDPDGFHVQPIDLAHALAETAEAAGARVCENSPVSRVGREAAGWCVETAGGSVSADRVVLATNVQSELISPILGRAILPVATYVVAGVLGEAALDEAITYRGAIADTRRAGDYYRRIGDRLIWGGRMTTQRAIPARLAEEMSGDIAGVYPQLGRMAFSHCWTGLMGYTRHQMPVVAELARGLFACTGFGGHGLNTCPAGAHAVAQAILGDRTELDLFSEFGPVWAGGPAGRAATQAEYWRRQMIDWWQERAA
ncbi:MAG: FAD-binding oxidoreductase [Pseudomonadota bacterium]